MTDIIAIPRKILYQIPMPLARDGMGRFVPVVYFCASSRISIRLFTNAHTGANGKADANIITNPNCIAISL